MHHHFAPAGGASRRQVAPQTMPAVIDELDGLNLPAVKGPVQHLPKVQWSNSVAVGCCEATWVEGSG